MKKIVSLLIIAVIITLSISSCGAKYFETAPETAVIIGDKEISHDLYRYFYCSYKYGENISQKTEEEIKAMAEKNLRELVAIEEMAEKYEVELSKETLKLLKLEMESMEDSYKTKDEMKKVLDEMFLSQKAYYDLNYFIELEALLYEYLTEEASMIIISSDKEVEEFVKSDFLAATNIVIYPDTEKDGLKGEALANSIRERIENGESFETLAEEYSDDDSKPRYFAPLTMQDYFEKKVSSLKIGEVSEVYETEVGYLITKRIDITDEYINKNFEELREEFKYGKYLAMMTEISDNYTVTYSEEFDMTKIDRKG